MKQETLTAARALIASLARVRQLEIDLCNAKHLRDKAEETLINEMGKEPTGESPMTSMAVDGVAFVLEEEYYDAKPGSRVRVVPIQGQAIPDNALELLKEFAQMPMSVETPGVAKDPDFDEMIGRARLIVGQS